MAAPELSPQAQRELQAAAVLLRATHGFLFLPLLVESERAAAAGLAFLQAQLGATMYPVAWPVEVLPTSEATPDTPSQLPALRIALLGNLDDAIAKLPPNAVLVLDASSSMRHALALETMAYINHRREPLRAAGLRFILCWPAALRQELLAHAPDMWSMRTASPWISEADLVQPSPAGAMPERAPSPITTQHELSPANVQKLAQWHAHHDLKAADLSPRDAVVLALELDTHGQWVDAAALAEAAYHAMNHPSLTALDEWTTKLHALNVLAIARHCLGNNNGALQAARAAVDQTRLLAQVNPEAFEVTLATNLNNLANFLSQSGDRTGALAAARETMEIYTRLAKANLAVFEPDLAMSANNLANYLSESGDRPGALVAAREAMEIYTRLVKANPTAFEPNLAGSMSNLACRLGENGDRSGALAAARGAVEIHKRLAQTNPSAFESDLAISLNNLANYLSENGNLPGALEAARESVETYRRLAKANPAAFEPSLAGSMNNWANHLNENGDLPSALAATREAIDIRRRLAKANPAAFEPVLAGSMKNWVIRLKQSGDLPGARTAAEEALRLYEQANQQHAGQYEAEIAQTRQLLDQLHKPPNPA